MTVSPLVFVGLSVEKRKMLLSGFFYSYADLENYLNSNYPFIFIKIRSHKYTHNRHSIIFVLNKYKRYFNHLNKSRIAELIKQDHSTIIHAIKSIENTIYLKNERDIDSKILPILEEIEKNFKIYFNI